MYITSTDQEIFGILITLGKSVRTTKSDYKRLLNKDTINKIKDWALVQNATLAMKINMLNLG